jgi:predicted nucleotidyltransferase
MFLDILEQRCGTSWPTIRRAHQQANVQMDRLKRLLQNPRRGSIDSEDVSVVVFGSLARGEWTTGSDVDWTLLIDGGADPAHADTAVQTDELLRAAGFKAPGPTGVFGSLTFSHNLIHQIGGEDDTNHNTTRRMLLLLESRPVHRAEAYDRVIRGILRRYLATDFQPFRLKLPRFLLNDVHRFWRTMCVDYASKFRDRAGHGWALRYVKLRLSRKLLFAAGLLACFACDPELVADAEPDLFAQPCLEGLVEYLRRFASRTPLEIVAEGLGRYARPETACLVLDAYEAFLAALDDRNVRAHLESLTPANAETDARYQELYAVSRAMQEGLHRLCCDDHPRLRWLTREYGTF